MAMKNNEEGRPLYAFDEYYKCTKQHIYESDENQHTSTNLGIFTGRENLLRISEGHLEFVELAQCKYCSSPLGPPRSRDVNERSALYRRGGCFFVCERCGWWHGRTIRNHVSETLVSRTVKTTQVYEAILKSFPVDSLEIPTDELRRHLDKHPVDLSRIAPTKLELLLQSVYRDFFACEVRHVGGPGDRGIDLYVIDAEVPFIVQVKRRGNTAIAESVATVRELLGAMIENGVYSGHIVTTAQRFSPRAVELSESPNLERLDMQLELLALEDLKSMLRVSNRALLHPAEELLNRLDLE